jgi:DNA primase
MDFRRLRNIDILDVCRWLGIELKCKGSVWRGSCPICRHPSERAFTVTPALNRFWCFGRCQDGGDALELVVRTKLISHPNAAKLLVDEFGGP